MKSHLMQCYLALWLFLGCVFAEGWQTNDVSASNAVQIASRLWRGMNQEEVVKAVEKENGLLLGLTAEVPRSGGYYLRLYSLRDGCTLQLKFERTNSYLTAASINGNGAKSISITLTNAPRSDAANGSQPVRPETNRSSAAAGSGR